MKRVIVLFVLAITSLSSFAQANVVAEKRFLDDPFNDPMLPLYLASAVAVIVVTLLAVVAIYMIRVLNLLTAQALKEKAEKLGVVYREKPTWWSRFSQSMNASVAIEEEKSIELDHNYDGIKELDNHLPPWWTWLFYGTIAWAAVYMIIFHFSLSLPLSIEEYEIEIAQAEEQRKKFKADEPESTVDENNLHYLADPAILEKGKAVFANNPCGSCHRNDGGGNAIGPNLTDEYWIHGGDVKNIFNTIKNGAVDKGMPAWGKVMSAQDVRDVTFYIISLQGTKPPDAKAGQGELFQETLIQGDSTQAAL